MKKRVWSVVPAAVITALLLTACGSGGYNPSRDASAAAYADEVGYYEASDDMYYADEPEMAMPEEAAAQGEYDTGSSDQAEILEAGTPETQRKLIKNMHMDLETEAFDQLLVNIEARVNALGGYIESSEINGRSYANWYETRTATIVARVPNDRMNDFVTAISKQSNIITKSQSTEDVTLSYADTKARIDTLKKEQSRLMDMIDQAEELDTLLRLEARLTEVSYQIESYERQIRSLDNKVDYATISLYIDEVAEYTPEPEPEPVTPGERMRAGLAESSADIADGFTEFFVGLVIALPKLIVTFAILGINVLIVLLIIRKCKKNARKRKEMQLMQQASAEQNTINSAAAPQEPVNPQEDAQQ